MNDQERGVGQQIGRAEGVEGHQRVQGSSGHFVPPVRRAGPRRAVVGVGLITGHGGFPAAGRYGWQVLVVAVQGGAEGGPVASDSHRLDHLRRAVVTAGDSGDRLDPRVRGGRPDGVTAAQADPGQTDTGWVYLGLGAQHAHGRSQVRQLPLAVLVLATTTALTEAAVIEGERDEPGRAQQFGVGTGDLLLDPGEGPGEHDRGRAVTRSGSRQPEIADEFHALARDGDPPPSPRRSISKSRVSKSRAGKSRAGRSRASMSLENCHIWQVRNGARDWPEGT